MSDFKNNTSNISDKELWDKITKKDKKYSKSNRVIFNKSKPAKIEKNINEKKSLYISWANDRNFNRWSRFINN